MTSLNILENAIQCLKTGEDLVYTEIDSQDFAVAVNDLYNNYGVTIDGFVHGESKKYFYPVLCGVIVMMEGFIFDAELNICGEATINPFTLHNETDSKWYDNYAALVNFKTEEMIDCIKKCQEKRGLVVEYMSSSGALLRAVHKECHSYFDGFVALDADFFALKELHENENNILTLCCDVTQKVFKNNTVAIALSNSVHHIPNETNRFYNNIMASLCRSGCFIGVESQGFLAKLVISIVFIMPRWLVPYSLKEVHAEKSLLKSWLKISIRERLRLAGIYNNVRFKRYLFHMRYLFEK